MSTNAVPAAPRFPPALRVLERGWVSSNNIVFLGRDEAAVVDTGYVRHAAQTVALVQHLLAGRPLARIVNTHTHSDHVGGNAALRRAYPQATITIPAGDSEVIRAWDQAALHLTTMGQECERFMFDATFARDDTLTLGDLPWRVVASPGHHMASLMLYCAEEAILISADALWQNGFGVMFPEIDGDPVSQGEAFAAQRATLESIAALTVRAVIPGHGAPFADVGAALERAFGRLAYFETHPERHARNGLKVALSFLLMIEGRIGLASLPARLAALPLAVRINQDHYQLDAAQLADFVIAELEKGGAAHRADGWLVSGKNPGIDAGTLPDKQQAATF